MHVLYPYLEKGIGYALTFIFHFDSNLSCTVQNNLKGHSARNSKTAFMYMIAITFLVFAGVVFSLIANLLTSTFKMFLGADLVGEMLDNNLPLNEYGIRGYLEEMKTIGLVKDFTFVTNSLASMMGNDGTNLRYRISLSPTASILSRSL